MDGASTFVGPSRFTQIIMAAAIAQLVLLALASASKVAAGAPSSCLWALVPPWQLFPCVVRVRLATTAAFSVMDAHHRSFAPALKTTRQSTRRGPPPLILHALVTWLCSAWI